MLSDFSNYLLFLKEPGKVHVETEFVFDRPCFYNFLYGYYQHAGKY